MARILFVWELGAGLGHITPIKHIVERIGKEHECFAALRDVQHAQKMLGESVKYVAAPYASYSPEVTHDSKSLSGLLYNSGFSNLSGLKSLISAWKTTFELVKPDLVIFDHSPSALLAAREFAFKKMTIGTGFFFPTKASPMGVFFPKQITDAEKQDVSSLEESLLATINQALTDLGQNEIEDLQSIYHHVDRALLSTYPEFDHYLDRQEGEYVGITALSSGKAPTWPNGKGKRIYAYLKPDENLPQLLNSLKNSGQPTLVYSNNISPEFLKQFQCDTLHFEFEPLSLKAVAEQGDFAILNCNHDTSVELILRGMPLISLPLQREQQILSRRIDRHGASIRVEPSNNTVQDIINALNSISSDESYKNNAMKLQASFADKDPFNAADRQIKVINTLLSE